MAVSKCRIDVWEPVLGGTLVSKWMTVQTASNFNAVISTFIGDKLGNSRRADIVVSNKAKDFTAPTSGGSSTFTYHYRDSDGVNINSSGYSVPKATGVLTDIFRDFQYIRVVDEGTKQIMFLGRIISIKEEYAARQGQVITLKCRDALYELILATNKGLSKSITFYPKGSITAQHSGHSPTDIVKALLGMVYRQDILNLHDTDHIKGSGSTNVVITDTLATDIVYSGGYDTNIVTSDSGTNARNRFQNDSKTVSTARKLDINKITSKGVLGEILNTLQNSPQDSQGNNENFGWDYFADPNISYGAHADFRGKNFDPVTEPPPAMFNVFKRGTRLANMAPLNYGLSVKYPAQIKVSTTNHKTDVNTSTTTTSIKPMSAEFEFDRPKEELYTTVLLTYNSGEEKAGGFLGFGGSKGTKETVRFDIMYVTEISGQFKYHAISGSGDDIVVSDFDFSDDADNYETDTTRPGLKSPEYLRLYESNGTTAVTGGEKIARIQYQSHTSISGATNFGYIIISADNDDYNLWTQLDAGTYVLKGVGTGDGTNASNATCKINLGANLARQGYPRRVWGLKKEKVISRGSEINPESIRQEVADTLHRSSAEIVNGNFTMSGPPLYYWDGVVRSISSVTGGQAITVKNVNGTNAVNLVDFGFREGMLMSHMIAGYGRMVTTAVSVNGSNVQKDVFGYCFDVNSDNVTYSVNLTESQDFEVGDPIRITMPLRAGDSIRVENILSDIAGNFMITDISFTEEPNQMTKLNVTGVNQGFGFTVSPFQASIADLRQESADILSLPKGHQVATWTGLFSAVDFNTIQWQTVNGKATVELQDGTIYNIDTSTTNDNNTTHASGTDGEGTRFGIANAAHPAVGDDTVYYIFVDANKENPLKDLSKTYHFYTRPADTPDSGSDSVYKQDGDNVIVGWMKAGATSGDTAEFGVYRDSKPGEGKRNLPSMVHTASATSALLKKGAQTFTTDLQIQASAYPNDLARRHVKWHGGEATADTTHANIKMADGDNRVIAYGGDTGDDGTGVNYAYTTNGSSYSNISAFSDNTTYYAFIDFVEDPTGNMTLRWTNSYSIPYGDDRVLLCMIVVPPDNTKGRSPLIFPFTTKSLSINAAAIAANSITADHIQANTIDTGQLSVGVNNLLNTTGNSTTSADTAPGSPIAGDLWIDTNSSPDNLLYRYSGSAWVPFDLGLSRARADAAFDDAGDAQSTANTKRTTFVDAQTNSTTGPIALAVGDIWINATDQKIYGCTTLSGNARTIGTNWTLRDDAGAINNAITNIAGGRIETQAIILKSGGAGNPNNTNSVLSTAGVSNNGAGTSRVVLSNTGIYGWSSGSAEQFSLRTDGAAHFQSGVGVIDSTGMYVTNGGYKVGWLKNDAGLVTGEGNNTGIDFRDLHDTGNALSAWLVSDRGGSITYGGNSAAGLRLKAYKRDMQFNSFDQDIGMGADPDSGKIAIFAGENSPTPFVFMDNDYHDSSERLHDTGNAFVGFTKREGRIRIADGSGGWYKKATIYRLPWTDGTGGPTGGSGEDYGKPLTIGNLVSGSGYITNPLVYDVSFDNTLRLPAGSLSAPSYSFTASNDSGMYKGGSSLDLVLGGATKFWMSATTNYNQNKIYSNNFPSTSSGSYARILSGTIYTYSSTARSKMEIQDLVIDSSKIYDLEPKSFKFRIPKKDEEGSEIYDENGIPEYTDMPQEDTLTFGMIAEEVYAQIPELVSLDGLNLPHSLDYPLLSVLLLEEVKKLKARIEVLEGN